MIRILIFLPMFLLLIKAEANVIHTVYFYPADIPPPAKETISEVEDIMLKTQTFYLREMKRHGYAPKTFNLERDALGQIVIHVVKGKHNLEVYFDFNAILAELPAKVQNFRQKTNIRVVFLAGARQINGAGGIAAGGIAVRDCQGFSCTHTAIIPNAGRWFWVMGMIDKKSEKLLTTIHEIGHTFGLAHNSKNPPDAKYFIMNPKTPINAVPFNLNDHIFDANEARLLNNHPFLVEGFWGVSPNTLAIKTWGTLKFHNR